MNIRPIGNNTNSNYSNLQPKINFKGDAERRLFESIVERKLQTTEGSYKSALKPIYDEIVNVFRIKYSSKFKQSEKHSNEFSLTFANKNFFKVEHKKGSISCVDKEKSREKRMGKLVGKTIANEIQFETHATKPIISKKKYITIKKDYAPNEAPYSNASEQIYDKDLKSFIG